MVASRFGIILFCWCLFDKKVFTGKSEGRIMHRTYGEMAEWLKAPVLKTGIRL